MTGTFEVRRQYCIVSEKLRARFYRRHGWASNCRRKKRQHELNGRDWRRLLAEEEAKIEAGEMQWQPTSLSGRRGGDGR